MRNFPDTSPLCVDTNLRSPMASVPLAGERSIAQCFRPQNADALWDLVTSPHPVVGTARHLGEAIVQAGLVSPQTMAACMKIQQEERGSGHHRQLGQILVEQGDLTREQLQHAIDSWLGTYMVDPRGLSADPQALALVPQAVAERESVLPLMVREDALVLLVASPLGRTLMDELRFLTQRRLVTVQGAPGTLLPAIQQAYRSHRAAAMPATQATGAPVAVPRATALELAGDLGRSARDVDAEPSDTVSESDNTLVRLINSIIDEAIAHRASDIHIETEPAPANVRIRLRVDGAMKPYLEVPGRFRFSIVARIKIMAGLDISEHRKPQDGKIDFSRFGGPAVELRVVTVPTAHGLEDVVLRLLEGAKPLPLEAIGLSSANLAALRAVVQKSYGLILVCGPTGSGKTTTLHSVIRDINTDGRKIWTAEDPIEITQSGLRQVQVNPRIGWTFAAAMRTFLRADPDVIMIGEMRDEETARVAVDASLTGHLVLSTLHTNSAPESIARLLEMGLNPFNFSDSLLAILAQRLVRRLCTACREPYAATGDALQSLATQFLGCDDGSGVTSSAHEALVQRWRAQYGAGTGEVKLWRRRGCSQCEHTGYHGRMGIHELMVSDEGIRRHIRRQAPASDIRHAAQAAGMHTLAQDGIEKVLQGYTDMAEVALASNL